MPVEHSSEQTVTVAVWV